MASVREHLIFKALAALNETVEACGGSVVVPTLSLRFCLAFLYAQSNGPRFSFDKFWQEIQKGHSTSTDGGQYLRQTEARASLYGIIECLGFNPTNEIMGSLRRAGTADAVRVFWEDVQRQADLGYPISGKRFRRDP